MLFSSLPSLESGSEIVQSLIPHYERRVLFGVPYAVGTELWKVAACKARGCTTTEFSESFVRGAYNAFFSLRVFSDGRAREWITWGGGVTKFIINHRYFYSHVWLAQIQLYLIAWMCAVHRQVSLQFSIVTCVCLYTYIFIHTHTHTYVSGV